MTRIRLRAGDAAPVLVEIHPGEAILVGREPDPARLPAGDPLGTPLGAIRAVRVASPRVSANHLLVIGRDEGVYVQDLGSRNGSWLKLPEHDAAAIAPGVDLAVQLARPDGGDAPRLRDLADAEWSEPAGFGLAVLAVVDRWLGEADLEARVTLSPDGYTEAEGFNLSLADGSCLHVARAGDETEFGPWSLVLARLSDYVARQNRRYEEEQGHSDEFILASPLFRAVHHDVAEAATLGTRLMLLGPSGAGKERLAQCFHLHSPRRNGPYTVVNCGLLKSELVYAQLFGARRGSFTGAAADLIGAVESAHGGTLFLDEVGELDPDVQRALLRFLDSRGEYQRLGDARPRHADIQLVCATNAPLDDPAKRRGRFRDDLWYRLAVRVVRVPALKDRREDVQEYLRRRKLRGGDLSVTDALEPEALALVLADPWPGNFRDLANFVARLPAASRSHSIGAAVCRAALAEGRGPGAASPEPVRMTTESSTGVDSALWLRVSAAAHRAFEEDHGGPPRDWGQMEMFTEKYLKPLFVASACGLEDLTELSRAINYSQLARRLHIADGATVKNHLRRYLERFRGVVQGR